MAEYQFNVPDAPENCTTKEISATGCTVKFDAPKWDGGSPITGYIVERRLTSNPRWIRVSREPVQDLELKVNDLIDGCEYEFRVIAENKAGQSEPSAPCKPFTAKNPFDRPGPPLDLKVGEVTKSSIELTWSPPTTDGGSPITGYKIERRNPKTLKWQEVQKVGKVLNTTLNNIKENNEYELRVIACNEIGESDPSNATPLIVAKNTIVGDKPTLIDRLNDVRVMVGQTAHFEAKLKAKPYPDIKWYANETLLGAKDDFVSIYDNNKLELSLHNCQLKDAGVYKVVVTNPLGQLVTDAKLTVLKKPTIEYDTRYDKKLDIVSMEQNLNISVRVSGFPRPDIKWFRNNEPLTETRAFFEYGEQLATLQMTKVKRDEGGEYKIIAENEVGKSEATFTVRVLDVPMPAKNLTAFEINSFNCKLKWSAPADDGNSPILNYHVEKLDPKRNVYTRLDSTSLTEYYVDKLERGQTYMFRVIAENKIGCSEPCFVGEPVVARGKFEIPGAPGVPQITDVSKTSCKVSWDAPRKDGGCPIKGYFVERKSGLKWIRVSKELIRERFIRLDDLSEGSEYEFRVCAVNEEGTGGFSQNSETVVAKSPFTRPDPPIQVNVNNISKDSCLLSWQPPIRNGGQPIIRYHVEMRQKGDYKFNRFTDDFISECEYQVNGLVENQEYEFRITAENRIGESLPSDPTFKFKARESVAGVPAQIEALNDQANLLGTQGKIEARVTGTPEPNIVWKKGSRTLKLDSSKYSISFAQSMAVLFINNVGEEDAGVYTIEAENSAGSDAKSCKYIVYSPPKIDYDKKLKKTCVVSVGSNFRVMCEVTGCPKPDVAWSKDGFKVTKQDKANVDNPTDNQHYLTVKQCDRTDSGLYVIKASNEYGKDEAKFELQVVDVPDKPRGPIDIDLDQEAKSVTLNWRAPKWDGGSDLLSYTIEYAKILEPSVSKSLSWFKAATVRPTTFNFTMDNLVKNSYYYFRIYAENAIGQSEPLEMEQPLSAKPAYGKTIF